MVILGEMLPSHFKQNVYFALITKTKTKFKRMAYHPEYPYHDLPLLPQSFKGD